MAKRRERDDYYSAIPIVRVALGYLCLLVLFGTVILLVQASIEINKARYYIGELNRDKFRLMDELRSLDNKIRALEGYERIASIVSEELPELGPPQYPAIVIEVVGLTDMGARPIAPPF